MALAGDIAEIASTTARTLAERTRRRVSATGIAGSVFVAAVAATAALAADFALPQWIVGLRPAIPVVYAVAITGAAVSAALFVFRGELEGDARLGWVGAGYAVGGFAVFLEAAQLAGFSSTGHVFDTSASGAAAIALLWHAAVPTFALAVMLRRRGRLRYLSRRGLVVLFGVLIAGVVWEPSFLPWPRLVTLAGDTTALHRGLSVGMTLYVLGVTGLWMRSTGRRPTWPEALVTISLALLAWDLVLDVVASRFLGAMWWASLVMQVAHFAVPATGLLIGIFELCRRAQRYERDLAEHLEDELNEISHADALQARAHRTQSEKATRIGEVLDDGGPSVVFQPIVNLDSGEVVGVEALSRFPDDPGEARSAADWLRDAGEVGLGTTLEVAAVRNALSAMPTLPRGAYLSVNASPKTVLSGALWDVLNSVDASRLVVEITEHAKINDYLEFLSALRHVERLGARIAVDDTGAGFASLRHVIRLAPHIIKLDIDITANIETDPIRRALAASLVSFAVDSGCELVAEGIETREQLAVLQSLSVPCGQGFLIKRPTTDMIPPRIDLSRHVLRDLPRPRAGRDVAAV